MTRRRQKRQVRNTNAQNKLVHPASTVVSGAGALTDVQASAFALLGSRPSRPTALEFSYFSTAPRSFVIHVYGFNDSNEEVYTSKVMLSGPIPRSARVQLPKSTDFAIANTTTPVIRIEHAGSAGLNFVFNLHVEYKFQTPNSFF
jgi:hypothetical protein